MAYYKMYCYKHSLVSTIIYLCLNNISYINGDIRIWKHSTRYNNPQNWVNGKVPCHTSPVVFPADLETDINFFPGENKISDLVLPRTGVLNLPSVEISFEFYETRRTQTCDGQDRIFKQLKKERWLDPNNWISSTYKNNTAIPDMERVPCQYDIVEFPTSTEFGVEFPNVAVQISGFIVNQNATYSPVEDEYSTVIIKNIIFNDGDECQLKSGCLCHPEKWENDDRLENEICDNERKHCKQVYCLTPIRPIGQCCDICGSMLLMKHTIEFSLNQFESFIEKFLKQNSIYNIDFYVSKVWNDQIQLIFRDRNEYSTKSNDVANQIKELIQKDDHLGLLFFSIHESGQYYNPDGVSGFKILFLTLFGALALMAGAYVVTQRSHQYPILPPSIRYNLRLNSLPSFGSYLPGRNTNFSLESCWPFSSYTELNSTQNENMEFLPTSHATECNSGQNGEEFENPLYNQEENIDESAIDTEVESYEENEVHDNSNDNDGDGTSKIVEIDADNQVEPLMNNSDLLDGNDTKDHPTNESSNTNAGQEITEDSLMDVIINNEL